MGKIHILDNRIINISDKKIEIINKKYKELKDTLEKKESERLNYNLKISTLDKEIYEIKKKIDKLEIEILKDTI